MNVSLRHPIAGHAAIVVAFVFSVGVVRAVYVEPRAREVRALRSSEERFQSELKDLLSGIHEMEGWATAHPGQDLWTFHARKALPATMSSPRGR